MANNKSSKKRARQEIKRRAVNLARKTDVKTAVKKVEKALDQGAENIKDLMREAEAKLARAKGKGKMHARTAERKISRLAKKVSQKTKEATR